MLCDFSIFVNRIGKLKTSQWLEVENKAAISKERKKTKLHDWKKWRNIEIKIDCRRAKRRPITVAGIFQCTNADFVYCVASCVGIDASFRSWNTNIVSFIDLIQSNQQFTISKNRISIWFGIQNGLRCHQNQLDPTMLFWDAESHSLYLRCFHLLRVVGVKSIKWYSCCLLLFLLLVLRIDGCGSFFVHF